MIKHHSTTPNVHSCAYRDFSHNFWKMYVEVIDLNIFKNNKFVAKVDLWSFGVTSTHLLKCNIRSVLCLTNFPPPPPDRSPQDTPMIFQVSNTAQWYWPSFIPETFFFAFTCQHHNHLYPNISIYILHTFFLYISSVTDEENLFINQSFLSWQSFRLFSGVKLRRIQPQVTPINKRFNYLATTLTINCNEFQVTRK